MKILRILFISVFSLCLIIPLMLFNFTPDSVSEIDNRKLTENPFLEETGSDLTENIENYINDRIGLRDEMILSYTVLNDKLFGKMVHPSYVYGKEGYVFGSGITVWDEFSDYHIAFADMILSLQNYCEARGVPFIFVFNPAKPAVYSEYLAEGVNYNRSWVELFLNELDKRNINYIDNTGILTELKNSGEAVFNKMYDANHWNDLGAYYGTNSVLEKLKEQLPSVHINDKSEFLIASDVKTSLLVSNFPINESVPYFALDTDYVSHKGILSELELHPSYKTCAYYENQDRKAENAAGALVFQGSYMNGYGYKYFINAFSEYVYIHDYQNVMELPYYFNIFKPDCVIFEVAEYTLEDGYFSLEKMLKINYNEPLQNFSDTPKISMGAPDIETEKGEYLTEITFKTDEEFDSVWLLLEDEYDMKMTEKGYTATVKNEDFNGNIEIITLKDEEMRSYK